MYGRAGPCGWFLYQTVVVRSGFAQQHVDAAPSLRGQVQRAIPFLAEGLYQRPEGHWLLPDCCPGFNSWHGGLLMNPWRGTALGPPFAFPCQSWSGGGCHPWTNSTGISPVDIFPPLPLDVVGGSGISIMGGCIWALPVMLVGASPSPSKRTYSSLCGGRWTLLTSQSACILVGGT